MSKPVDRDLVERLLEDESLTYREIARRSQCSDWTVRRIARQLGGDDGPMKHSRRIASVSEGETLGAGGWAMLIGIGVAFIAGIWWLCRPPRGGQA